MVSDENCVATAFGPHERAPAQHNSSKAAAIAIKYSCRGNNLLTKATYNEYVYGRPKRPSTDAILINES